MKTSSKLFLLGALILAQGCTEKNTNITQVVGPTDWQGPTVEWTTPMDAEVRGTVGLDVSVHDSSSILRVKLYVDGYEDQTLSAAPYRFTVVTDSLADGVHLCEARAWDQCQNLGSSPVLRVNVVNNLAEGPRVLWVPDSFATIQSAINAATDYDTIRVRDGVYHEAMWLFGKGLFVESEDGPVTCKVDAGRTNVALMVSPSAIPAVVRGFWLSALGYIVSVGSSAQVSLFNNIVEADTADGTLITGSYAGNVRNNLFAGSHYGVQISYCLGSFYNNIIMNVDNVAFWNAAVLENPLRYGYNVLWNNGQNYGYFEPGVGDILSDPEIDLENQRLLPDSPAIDAGHPDIRDIDGSRSDIGPFGGPWAYDN